MIITMDSAVFSGIAARLAAAKEKVDESDRILGGVPEHGDWACAERERLWEEVCAVRQASQSLTESAEELSSKVNLLLEDLQAQENTAAAKERELEELVASLAASCGGEA